MRKASSTEGSADFTPDAYFEAWSSGRISAPYDNDFRKFIIKTFGLQPRDDYIYRATAEVTLLQAQTYLEVGAQGGLHAWYRDAEEEKKLRPTASDIAAYSDIFRPTTVTGKLLLGFASNAKKNSVRLEVAQHLLRHYFPADRHPGRYTNVKIARCKDHVNPYFDVWAWSNQMLEWTGPEPNTAHVKFSHAILPVLYHHFGCVCPSYEALSYIDQIAGSRTILDIGSGNGYWTYMLRRFRCSSPKKTLSVVAVDSGLSEWRTMWTDDTIVADGARWLGHNASGQDAVLLLVYPSVGHEFTARMIQAYKGTTIICCGSQNANGFTAFAETTIAEWVAKELPAWEKVLQIPLPSFAGKDEAMFVFEKVR